MVELDYDQVLEELTNFTTNKTDADAPQSYPEILDRYLEIVAKNGDTIFPWSKVKPFIRRKLEMVMDAFHRDNPLSETALRVPNCKPFDYAEYRGEIMKSFDWFYAAPFTIQRLCELLIDPNKHYHRTDKFLRGLEKNVLVVSTIQPRPNKYATAETSMEKQSPFKDIFNSSFNSNSPSQNNHNLSSSSSASGSTSPHTGAGVLNGSLDAATSVGGHGPNNYNGANTSPYHPLANPFPYDQAAPVSPSLNDHHHPHLLDSLNADSAANHLHHSHHQHPHSHPPPHHSSLAPLQQLDSFTNVFTTSTTHHHLTHLNSSYNPLEGSHLTNDTNAWSTHDSAMKHSGGSPYDSLLNQAPSSHSHNNNHEHLNNSHDDNNENIVVDDDDEEMAEAVEAAVATTTTLVEKVLSKASNGGGPEEEPSVYSNDSSSNCSNASDSSSSLNSDDTSNDKEDHVVTDATPTNDSPIEASPSIAETEANIEAADPASALAQELTPNSTQKRPSPTPQVESPEASKAPFGIAGDDAEPPLTPKKLRAEEAEENQEEEIAKQPAELAPIEMQQ